MYAYRMRELHLGLRDIKHPMKQGRAELHGRIRSSDNHVDIRLAICMKVDHTL